MVQGCCSVVDNIEKTEIKNEQSMTLKLKYLKILTIIHAQLKLDNMMLVNNLAWQSHLMKIKMTQSFYVFHTEATFKYSTTSVQLCLYNDRCIQVTFIMFDSCIDSRPAELLNVLILWFLHPTLGMEMRSLHLAEKNFGFKYEFVHGFITLYWYTASWIFFF